MRPRVRVGRIELAYDVSGDAGAPPMVLLHGLGERASGWDPVLARFAERFQVYALDLRGHGDSDRAEEYTHDLMAADVRAALDELGLSGVVLVGHSLGGAVAYRVAIDRPELVSRLVVEDAPPPYLRNRPIPPRPDEPVDFDWAVVAPIVREVNAGSPETWDALPTVKAPTLLIGGGPESHIPQAKLAEVAALIPDCRLVTIPVGHHVHESAPQEFADAVLGWLRA